MGLLRMLNRSAFICNVCFLLAIMILRVRQPVDPGLASLIIVMGFVLSIVFNLIVNFWHLARWISKKTLKEIPRSFIYLNFGFLVIQLILLLK
jgi:hypothetical protein